MLLEQCSPTAQWLYGKIVPIMENGTPYGYIHYFESELGTMFKISQTTVSHALHDLRHHGLLRKSRAGAWYCPAMISQMVSKVAS